MTFEARLNVLPLAAVLVALSGAGCIGRYVRPTSEVPFDRSPEKVERGRYVVESVAACGGCHTARPGGAILEAEDADRRLGGGNLIEDNGVVLYVPNLTSDLETGLGGWTDDQIARGIRDGITHEGKVLFPMMPYPAYQHMSDDDVQSVVAYLRSLPPVKPSLPRRPSELPFMLRMAIGAGVALHTPARDVKAPSPGDRVAQGKYLARLAHCSECHSFGGKGARSEGDRELSGSDEPFSLKGVGKVWAANLTPDPETGLGKASDDQIKAVLRSGRRIDGKTLAPPMSLLVPHFATMTEDDLSAIVAWMRSLPPVKQQVPPRQLEPEFAKLLGD